MTTIAWDGKTLAGDSQASMFNGSTRKVSKIVNGWLYGACGQWQDAVAVRQWIVGGMDADKKPKVEDTFHAILITQDGLNVLENKLVLLRYDRPYFAVGSGREYAMAAMLLGCDARHAVEVAAKLDTDTGGEITEVKL